jgi:hypothetical protein
MPDIDGFQPRHCQLGPELYWQEVSDRQCEETRTVGYALKRSIGFGVILCGFLAWSFGDGSTIDEFTNEQN